MIQDRDIDAWLGDARGDLTDEQVAEFAAIVRRYEGEIATRRAGERADWAEEDTAAWVAALEHVEGRLDLTGRGRAYREAKTAAYMGAVVTVLAGAASEVQAASDAAMSRPTLRRTLGK